MSAYMKRVGMAALVLTLAAVCRPAAARESEQRKVGSFDGIRVSGNLTLYIEEGSTESLRVEVDGVELDRVVSEVSDNSLTVRTKSGVFPDVYEIRAYVTYRTLRNLRAGFGSAVYGSTTVRGDSVDIEVVSNATARLKVDLNNLVVTVASGGELTLTGRAQTQETTANTGGKLDAFELDCDNAYLRVNTGAVCRVKATKLLEATVATGGSLRYKGNPLKQNIKKNTGGTVAELQE
jgi:hypothetical protein